MKPLVAAVAVLVALASGAPLLVQEQQFWTPKEMVHIRARAERGGAADFSPVTEVIRCSVP